MHVLVTGGAGFIGSHLCESLLKKNYFVTVIDDLSTGSKENLSVLENNSKFKFVEGSITDNSLMAQLVKNSDVIFHMAAAVGVHLVMKKPLETLHTNIDGTSIVLRLASKYNKRIIIASTSEIYGKSQKDIFNEKDDVLIGSTSISRWGYACSKALDEFFAFAYHREHNLPVTIVRFFNTVGPRQSSHYGMVIPRFIKQALKGDDITIYGTGKQSRCFIHVKDAVGALMKLLDNEKSYGHIYNIGNPEEISIKELANKILKKTNSESIIKYIPYSEVFTTKNTFEDMVRRVPDITKINELIAFSPKRNLNQILDETIEHMKK